jgi:trehalose 6-phosphate synthase/phosphatase
MNKNIIVSNRLPIRISKIENSFQFNPTSGGLATGMHSVHKDGESLWVGWPGIGIDEISPADWEPLNKELIDNNYSPVLLNKEEVDSFYYGLANECLWPLFHYFIEFANFDENQWNAYYEVNQKFAERVLEKISPGDTVWVHDYQLLLLPKMIKEIRPDVTIGFFLHIPFPSFEIFRIFPWREALLEGMLGADLIGFHTYDYERHFLSSVKRILRYDVHFNRVNTGTREVVVQAFPMGIDYEKFNQSAQTHLAQKRDEKSAIKKQLELHQKSAHDGQLILSIDRLDYTKGVVNRIKAFDLFLSKYPEYLEKVRLVMLTVPSRSDVPEYGRLKKETDEIVGRVNGKYATVNWTPIWYYYRAMDFDDLIDLYMKSDIAMITPVRDGMNLVAKEFIACRVEKDGVLILSEMAGASKELFESILVNPFDENAMADAIYKAVNMPISEQMERNNAMQKRLKRYTVEHWAQEFMNALKLRSNVKEETTVLKITPNEQNDFANSFNKAKDKVVFLDYDGTLVGFNENPELAIPGQDLITLLKNLAEQPQTKVVLISGRDQKFLEKWFHELPITLVAEHGHYSKEYNSSWIERIDDQKDWKDDILPVFQSFTYRTPGSFVEEKNNCLVWHYRKSDPELAKQRVVEIKTVLDSLISDKLRLLDMDKAVEVASSKINKGSAVLEIINKKNYNFMLCIGDDVTDENMFTNLPKSALTVKVGKKPTSAAYYVENINQVKQLLSKLISH